MGGTISTWVSGGTPDGKQCRARIRAGRHPHQRSVFPGTIATAMVTDMIDKGPTRPRRSRKPINPLNRLGRLEEIARAVLTLCSPGASFVIGVALPVDGRLHRPLTTARTSDRLCAGTSQARAGLAQSRMRSNSTMPQLADVSKANARERISSTSAKFSMHRQRAKS
jgi:Enoyl-(Acyl carrier protein) reductase